MGKRRGHGEGAIYQRESDGLWCTSVDLGIINGKRRRKVIYGKTRKEVADKLKALHRDQAIGVNVAPEQYTVEQFLNRWLDEVICNREPRTQVSYRATINNHIVPLIGHYKLQKLLPEHVQAMANALRQKQPAEGKRKLGPRSVEYACLVLSRALNQAKRWGYVAKNVVNDVELPKVRRPKIQPATEQQARALLAAVKGHRLEGIYWVALFLGLRRGEVLGLKIQSLDLTTKTLSVDGSLQRVGKELVRSNTKTESSQRTLPIPEPVVRILRAHLKRLETERLSDGDDWEEHGYLFPSERGTPIEPSNLIRHFKAALKRAGLPETARFHDLRHWCASLLISYKVHPKAIQEILGHANITTTLNVYGHLLPNVLRDAADQMAGLAGEDDETLTPDEADDDQSDEDEDEDDEDDEDEAPESGE
jgi:integrase